MVDYVPLNSPAARDGLAAGDTIVRYNSVDHPTWEQILEESALKLNRTIPMSFQHGGATLSAERTVSTGESGELTPLADSYARICRATLTRSS